MASTNAQAPATAPELGHVDSQLQLRFPAKLAQLRYQRVTRFSHEKLGYCVNYAGKDETAQICVYDFGYQNLPTGVDSKEFIEALRIAEESTLKAFANWPYRNVQLIATGTPSVQIDGKQARAEMRMFSSEMQEDPGKAPVPNMHLVLMTSGLGKFLKLNYTARNFTQDAFADETDVIVKAFVQSNGATLQKLMVDQKK